MQVAVPEIDGATEPFVYGGMSEQTTAPVPLADRCERLARRLKHWQHLPTASRADLPLALVALFATLQRLRAEGYTVELPASADDLRARLLGGNSDRFAATTHVAYRMTMDEY